MDSFFSTEATPASHSPLLLHPTELVSLAGGACGATLFFFKPYYSDACQEAYSRLMDSFCSQQDSREEEGRRGEPAKVGSLLLVEEGGWSCQG